MKRAYLLVLAGALSFGCRKDAPHRSIVPPWQWTVTGMKPGSVAAEPALVVCEANGSACNPVKAGVQLSGNKLIRLERGVSDLTLDGATHIEVAEGSELLLTDSPRTVELRAGGISLSRSAEVPEAGSLRLKLVDRTVELLGRSSVVARRENLHRAQLFVTRGVVKSGEPAPRELHPGEGAVFENAAPPDLSALFAGKVNRFKQTVLAIAHPPPPPPPPNVVAPPRGLGSMTARVPGTTAVVEGVRLARHLVRAVVRDGVAQTEVEEVFQNDTDRVLEGRYAFPLPPDATISGLTLYVGDKPVEGELVEKKRAAAIFKGIVDDTVRPRDPALLEWVRGSEFALKVFPLPARGNRRVVLRYQQVLTSDGPSQAYVYPLSFGSERRTAIEELRIEVALSDGAEPVQGVVPGGYPATVSTSKQASHVVLRATNTAPDHDFVVSYRRAAPGATTAVAEQGFVAMRLRAELPPGSPPPRFQTRDRVVVLDASHSQSRESFAAGQALALESLRSLEPDERFALLICDSACEARPASGLAPANSAALAEAEALVKARQPSGASDLAGALKAAVERVPVGSAVQIVYVGDGAPSAGELSVTSIASRVRPSFEQRKVDLRLFGAGSSVDEVTLGALSRELSGSYDSLSSAGSLAEQTEQLVTGLRAPLLVAPSLEVPGNVSELEPRVLPNLRLGEELVVVGKYVGSVPFNVTLRGRLGGESYALLRAVAVQPGGSSPFAARLWAESRIRALETSSDPSALAQLIQTSKQFRVMSRETSWLVLENEQMFAEFGIPRTAPPSAPLDPSGALAQELDQTDLDALGPASQGNGVPSPSPLPAPAAPAAEPAKPQASPPKRSAPASPPAKAAESSTEGGPGAVRPGASGGGLSGIGSTGRSDGSGADSGKVSMPRGNATIGSASVSGGTVANAARVVAGMRAGFRNCYQRGLAEDPSSSGTLRLTIRVGPGGEVVNVTRVANGNLPASVVGCVTARAQAAQFDPPDRGQATIVVPVTFTRDEANPVIASPSPFAPPRTIPQDTAVTRPGDESWVGQGQAALAKLETDLASAPTSRKKHEALVRGLLQRGRFAPALAAAERFVTLDPDLPVARELFAYAAVASGDKQRATAALDALTENAPTDPKAQGRAARSFEAIGDELRACAHWRALYELAKTSDAAQFESFRCRARVLGDREAALRDAKSISKPGPLLQRLLPQLESGTPPPFERSSGSPGQFEVSLKCETGNDCPFAIVITPTGTVFSPWTPALGRSSPTSFAFSGLMSATYRVLLVGGSPQAHGQVEVRALNTRNAFPFGPGHAPTIASTQVTLADASRIGIGSLTRVF
jgi:hypothetical protein